MLKRIISFFLALAICISSIPVANAVDDDNDYQSRIMNYWDSVLYALCHDADALGMGIAFLMGFTEETGSDLASAFSSIMVGRTCAFLDPDVICEFSDDHYHHASFLSPGVFYSEKYGYYSEAVCNYCGLSFDFYSSDLQFQYDSHSASLDLPTASNGISTTGFSVSRIKVNGSWAYWDLYAENWQSCFYNAYHNNSAIVIGVYAERMWGFYWDEHGRLCNGFWVNPLGLTHASALGVYALPSLTLVNSFLLPENIFFDKTVAESYSDFLFSSCYAVNWNEPFDTNGLQCFYTKSAKNVTWNTDLKYDSRFVVFGNVYQGWGDIVSAGYVTGNMREYPASADVISWDNSRIVVQPSGVDSSSRTSSLMSLLDEYNTLNSYLENEDAVNFFLGSVDSDGNIMGVYGPSVYDEETLIFTEPVSGAQYQTTGWTYDYYTRSYDISLEAGTMVVGQREATRIVLSYDDDKVRISYYADNGLRLAVEEYSYVMASQSSCALDGHSYSVETLTEATCTAQGERLYTCSVCGDQKVEDVPMKDHRVVHSVFKDATCTDPGYALYVCLDCGTEYGEPVPALGHDWISTDSSDSTYALPEDAACPECASVDFSSALDRESAVYTCTCNACGTQWLESAQVTHGYTTYTCSRCGARKTESKDETDNGLFQSIGNFVANGIRWCTDKLSQFVDGLTGMLDTFNEYLEQIGEHNSSYPSFLGKFIAILPEDMMAVIWFLIVAAIVVAVIKFWFR